MKQLLFCTVFLNDEALSLAYFLLESLLLFGDLQDDTDVLIYTSSKFEQRIKESNLYVAGKYFFHINNGINNIYSACCARLDVFDIPLVASYGKILYIDIDILISGSVQSLFDLIKEDDILYALEEGSTYSVNHGGILLRESANPLPPNKTAFTTGIMGFTNSQKVKQLFTKTKQHIQEDGRQLSCYDQPFIVYNAFMLNMYDNQVFKSFVINHPTDIHSQHVIRHFPGGPGDFGHKLDKIEQYMRELKNNLVTSR